jgi:hypothetical protein
LDGIRNRVAYRGGDRFDGGGAKLNERAFFFSACHNEYRIAVERGMDWSYGYRVAVVRYIGEFIRLLFCQRGVCKDTAYRRILSL